MDRPAMELPQEERPDEAGDDTVRWRQVYAGVAIYLAVVIALLYGFYRYFAG